MANPFEGAELLDQPQRHKAHDDAILTVQQWDDLFAAIQRTLTEPLWRDVLPNPFMQGA